MYRIFINTFLVTFAQKANSLIYFLKKIPFVGKLIKDSLYGEREAKKILGVITMVIAFIKNFLTKTIYGFFMILLPVSLIQDNIGTSLKDMDMFIYAFFMMNFILGSLINGSIFTVDEGAFHMIKLMRANPRDYYLTKVFTKALSGIIFFMPGFLIVGYTLKETLVILISLGFFRVLGEGVNTLLYDKFKVSCNTKTYISVLVVIIAIVGAFLPLALGIDIPIRVILCNPIFILITGVLSLLVGYKLYYYKGFTKISREILTIDALINVEKAMANATFADVKINEKKISSELLDSRKFDKKEGYDYLNELFFFRHRRIVEKSIKIRVMIISIAFVIVSIVVGFFLQDKKGDILGILENSVPFLVFFMYSISTTDRICRAMFVNCDISLLRYNYYREGEAIIKSFKVRLKKLVFFNMIPALTICLGMQVLVLICGGNDILKMIPIYLSVVLLSVFFSVYYLCLYYVLQPYTSELAVKNPLFSLANAVIYIVAYGSLQIETSSTVFTFGVLIVTIIAIISSLFLVYKVAPKSFKLK